MTTRWTIGIDWDRDGDYTDETARVLSASWALGFQQAYMDVGNDAQLTLILRNDDRRFSPENSAGSLYGKLAPLRPVKIESNDGTTTRRHFSGWVQSIHPAANRNGERVAMIRVSGAMQFLKATETKIELQENQRSDRIIDALINEVIFPPALSDSWVLGDPDYSKLGESTTTPEPQLRIQGIISSGSDTATRKMTYPSASVRMDFVGCTFRRSVCHHRAHKIHRTEDC